MKNHKINSTSILKMNKISVSDAEFTTKKRKTRREKFLEEMEVVVPRGKLESIIKTHCPKVSNGSRPSPSIIK